MTKKILLFIGLGILLASCGAKKKTTYGNKLRTPNTVVEKEREKEKPANDVDDLPDFGNKFIKFDISTTEEYINTFAEFAQSEMKDYGIPASITLAQGILESGSGRGELAQKTNNHFGIKCHTGWYGDYVNHDDDAKGECFRKYVHPMLSYRDHSLFLTTRSRYAFLFNLRADDYKGWARGLREAGYATDRHYPQKLIDLIEKYRLYRYDDEVIHGGGIVVQNGAKAQGTVAQSSPSYTTHIVEKGDTLYSISRKYLVSVAELMRLNNMDSSLLSIGQRLLIKTENTNK